MLSKQDGLLKKKKSIYQKNQINQFKKQMEGHRPTEDTDAHGKDWIKRAEDKD